jgi:hypothetical protein
VGLSIRVLYISFTRLPFLALLSIDGINACLPHLALLFFF